MPQNKNHDRFLSGCILPLFGLPFLCVGIGMTGWYFHSWFSFWRTQQWSEVPCVIESVSLVGNGDTHEAKATYHYRYQGQPYRSERVSFFSGSDNIDSFHRDVYDELKKYRVSQAEFDDQDSGTKTFRCYVDPSTPTNAVLYRNYRWQLQLFKMPFSILFGSFGAAFVFGSLISQRNSKRIDALKETYPAEPWKHSLDWTEHGIADSRSRSQTYLFAFTIFTGCLLLAHVHALLVAQPYTRDPNAWVAFVPLVIWLLPAWFSLRRMRHLRTLGNCYLRLVEPSPSRQEIWRAHIIHQKGKLPQLPIRVRFLCIKTIQKKSQKQSQTETLWEETQIIEPSQFRAFAPNTIPLSFAIPRDAPESNDSDDQTITYEWLLDFSQPRSAVRSKFKVPMHFSQREHSSIESPHSTTPSINDATDRELLTLLKKSHIIMETDPTGKATKITCTRRRMLPAALFMFLFSIIWTTAAIFLVKTNGPQLFQVIWSVTSAILWIILPILSLHQRKVEFGNEELIITHRWGPVKRVVTLPRNKIERFDVSLNNNDVRAVEKNGKTHTIVDALVHSLLAESTAKRLRKWL